MDGHAPLHARLHRLAHGAGDVLCPVGNPLRCFPMVPPLPGRPAGRLEHSGLRPFLFRLGRDRSKLSTDRHQRRQRSDRLVDLHGGFFHVVGLPQGSAQRRAAGQGRAPRGEGGRGQSPGLARSGVHRADRHDRHDVRAGDLGGAAESALRATGHERQGAEPQQGPLVLLGATGNVGLL